MTTSKHALWIRIVLGVVATMILLTTLPAYLNPANNPGLKALTGEAASLGSVAGLFLGRQLTIALIALYGAVRGTTEPLLIGAFGLAAFNLHDAIFVGAANGAVPGAIAGLVLAVLCAGLIWAVLRNRPISAAI